MIDDFHYAIPDAVHVSDPCHRIGGFQRFGHAFGMGELGGQTGCHFSSVGVGRGEVFFQLTRKQQICVQIAAVGFEIGKPAATPDAKGREVVLADGQVIVSDQFIGEAGAFVFDVWLHVRFLLHLMRCFSLRR